MTARRAKFLKSNNGDTITVSQAVPEVPPPGFFKPVASTFPIMDLPYDIREKILQFDALDYVSQASPSLHIRVYLPGNYNAAPTAIRLPPLTQAGDRTLRLQSILVTIKLITVEIHSGPGNARLQTWLESLNLDGSGETRLRTGFDAVHSLYFPYFSRYPFYTLPANAPNNDVQLMRRCANLRKVRLNFAHETLSNNQGAIKSVEDFRRDYRLDGMLDLPSLVTLTLQNSSLDLNGVPLLMPLKVWFESEFSKKGRSVTVTIS